MKNSTLIYNTGQKSKESLITEFVIRIKEYSKIMEDLQTTNKGEHPQNYIIVGVRGMGKTMLLHRIKYGIKDNGKLTKKLIPIAFAEELYNVSELIDFWLHIAELLEEEHKDFKDLYSNLLLLNPLEEREVFNKLLSAIKKHGKNLVLLIDNFDDLIRKFEPNEIQRLREILITYEEIRIIAATSKVLEETYKYEEPFYEFFMYIKLEGLNKEETQKLLKNLGKLFNESNRVNEILRKEQYRVEALRRLSGGNPRTIVLLYEILQTDNSSNTFNYLNEILDRNVTALYKNRMDSLKPQQQKIVNEVALAWDAVTVKDLTKKLRIDGKQISSQLNQLASSNIIEKIQTGGKNNLYQIKERFFNIWYLMRFSNARNKNRVKWLIKFFDVWCTPKDLRKKLNSIVCEIIDQGEVNDGAKMILDALPQSKICDHILQKDIELISSYSKEDKIFKKIQPYLKKIVNGDEKAWNDIARITKRETVINNLAEARKSKSKGELENSIKYYLKASELDDRSANHQLGHLYFKVKKYDLGIKYFLKAIQQQKGRKNYICLANELSNAGLNKQAIEYYLKDAKENKKNRSKLIAAEIYYCDLNMVEEAKNLYLEILPSLKSIDDKERIYHRLAHINSDEGNFKESERYFNLENEITKSEAGGCQIINYFKFNTNLNKAKELAISYNSREKTSNSQLILATILLWGDEIVESVDLFKESLKDPIILDEDLDGVIEYFTLLIAKGNLNYADSLITEIQTLADRMRPMYFAIKYLLANKYPNEYKKMGPELKETVNEIIESIKNYEQKYKTVANNRYDVITPLS
jgi:tetratricopeptide (TPR) repeat protein